jgi:spoIIIJ-associated protein
VEGYLKNKRTNLENMARRMGEKAKRTGKPTSFGQMNAHDRRIVHIALKEDDKVWTQSMGDGFYRKLVIFPKKKNGRKQK